MYFNNILFIIIRCFNSNTYYRFKIKEINLGCISNVSLWLECCKIEAFKKAYFLFAHKRFNVKNSFTVIFLIITKIPVKISRLFYYFLITNKSNFTHGLEIYYASLYYSTKFFKIEVFNKQIYLNGNDLKTFLTFFSFTKNEIIPTHMVNVLLKLRKQAFDFKCEEDKMQQFTQFQLMMTKPKNSQINIPARYVNQKHDFFIHAISNKPQHLLENQRAYTPISSLTLKKAINPATIIIKGAEVVELSKSTKLVPTIELTCVQMEAHNQELVEKNNILQTMSKLTQEQKNVNTVLEERILSEKIAKELLKIDSDVMSGHINFVPQSEQNYYQYKYETYRQILYTSFPSTYMKIDPTLYKQLVGNYFTEMLISGDEVDFINEVMIQTTYYFSNKFLP